MDLGLQGRVALVGGSSRGLGRAIAHELATEGASVVITARGGEALERTRRELEAATGSPIVAVAADLSTIEGVEAVWRAALDAFGRVDVLVNNTGGPPAAPFESHSPQAWSAAVRLLLDSAVNLSRLALPGMKQRRWGRIINITSIAVKQPVENLVLSNSVRAAVTGFGRTLANEAAPYGVTVNNVMPGYTDTERVEHLAESQAKERGTTPEVERDRWASEIPMGRLGRPEELAALVAFLASDRASYMTGTSIAVDGGWIKGLL